VNVNGSSSRAARGNRAKFFFLRKFSDYTRKYSLSFIPVIISFILVTTKKLF